MFSISRLSEIRIAIKQREMIPFSYQRNLGLDSKLIIPSMFNNV